MSVYNVIGSVENLKRLREEFPEILVVDRFTSCDWNVELPENHDYEDKFVEWCENNQVKHILA